MKFIDNLILNLVEKTSYWFQLKTGKNNFWLAQFLLVPLFLYWYVLFYRFNYMIGMQAVIWFSFVCLVMIWKCKHQLCSLKGDVSKYIHRTFPLRIVLIFTTGISFICFVVSGESIRLVIFLSLLVYTLINYLVSVIPLSQPAEEAEKDYRHLE